MDRQLFVLSPSPDLNLGQAQSSESTTDSVSPQRKGKSVDISSLPTSGRTQKEYPGESSRPHPNVAHVLEDHVKPHHDHVEQGSSTGTNAERTQRGCNSINAPSQPYSALDHGKSHGESSRQATNVDHVLEGHVASHRERVDRATTHPRSEDHSATHNSRSPLLNLEDESDLRIVAEAGPAIVDTEFTELRGYYGSDTPPFVMTSRATKRPPGVEVTVDLTCRNGLRDFHRQATMTVYKYGKKGVVWVLKLDPEHSFIVKSFASDAKFGTKFSRWLGVGKGFPQQPSAFLSREESERLERLADENTRIKQNVNRPLPAIIENERVRHPETPDADDELERQSRGMTLDESPSAHNANGSNSPASTVRIKRERSPSEDAISRGRPATRPRLHQYQRSPSVLMVNARELLKLDLYKQANTTLHFLLSTNDYGGVPVPLEDCMSIDKFFATAYVAWKLKADTEEVAAVSVSFEWLKDGMPMVITKAVEKSFQKMLEAIDEAPCWQNQPGAKPKCNVFVKIIMR